MAKQMIYGDDVWRKLEAGVDKVANAVKITVGPRGQNVVLEKNYGSPIITNDGVTIAKEINLEDRFENMGAQLIVEVASKSNDVAGDGTTTATILAQAIFKQGLKNIVAGANAMAVKRGIQQAVDVAVAELKKNSVKVEDKLKIAQVASIAANNDSTIGDIIAEAIGKVGNEGVITVEESKTFDTTLEVVEGMQFNRGFISPYFANNPENTTALLNNPLILITDKKISNIKDLVPSLEKISQAGRPILIIADDIEGEALATLVVNKVRGVISAAAVRAPDFGDTRKAMLEDIAILTNANYITDDFGIKLDGITLTDFGTAKTVKITKDETTIIEGAGDPQKIKDRIEALKKQLELIENDHEKSKVKNRIAKLSSGVAIIYAGAATETELKEKKYRIEDSLNATKAAIEEGVDDGGGVALVRTKKVLDALYNESIGDEKIGVDIVRKSVVEPLRQIAINSGFSGDVVLNRVYDSAPDVGFNAIKLEYIDMYMAGIIDPLKITRCALQNAASVAGMLLTTGCLIAEKEKPKDNQQQVMM